MSNTETPFAFTLNVGGKLIRVIAGGHCCDCRWWDGQSNYSDEPSFGHCGREKQEGNLMLAEGDPYASLYTSPAFGCVQCETK